MLPKELLAKFVGCGFSCNFVAHKEQNSTQTVISLRERARSEEENCRKNAPNNFASSSKGINLFWEP